MGDVTDLISRDLVGKPVKPGDAAHEIRLISEHFLISLWSARKKLLFPLDPASAGGAMKPQCGSAS